MTPGTQAPQAKGTTVVLLGVLEVRIDLSATGEGMLGEEVHPLTDSGLAVRLNFATKHQSLDKMNQLIQCSKHGTVSKLENGDTVKC